MKYWNFNETQNGWLSCIFCHLVKRFEVDFTFPFLLSEAVCFYLGMRVCRGLALTTSILLLFYIAHPGKCLSLLITLSRSAPFCRHGLVETRVRIRVRSYLLAVVQLLEGCASRKKFLATLVMHGGDGSWDWGRFDRQSPRWMLLLIWERKRRARERECPTRYSWLRSAWARTLWCIFEIFIKAFLLADQMCAKWDLSLMFIYDLSRFLCHMLNMCMHFIVPFTCTLIYPLPLWYSVSFSRLFIFFHFL